MRTYYCDEFILSLPAGHRFPMEKYRLLRERLSDLDLRIPPGADDDALRRVHAPEYVARVRDGLLAPDEIRRIGFPWSPELVERSRRSVGGTMAAGRSALEDGASANLAGGTHHAFADRGEGFCVFNDVAVAIRSLQAEGRIRRASVLDLDVHQGDGTAAIFRDDPSVFTVSVHGSKNYPFRKETSDLDLALPDGAEDDAFLDAVDAALKALVTRAKPDLVFYLAGADAFAGDRLGRLSVSREGMAERDRRTVAVMRHEGIPLAVVMGGGYAVPIEDTVTIHAHSVTEAAGLAGRVTRAPPLAWESQGAGR